MSLIWFRPASLGLLALSFLAVPSAPGGMISLTASGTATVSAGYAILDVKQSLHLHATVNTAAENAAFPGLPVTLSASGPFFDAGANCTPHGVGSCTVAANSGGRLDSITVQGWLTDFWSGTYTVGLSNDTFVHNQFDVYHIPSGDYTLLASAYFQVFGLHTQPLPFSWTETVTLSWYDPVGSISVISNPEPGTISLMVLGFASLLLSAKRLRFSRRRAL